MGATIFFVVAVVMIAIFIAAVKGQERLDMIRRMHKKEEEDNEQR